MLHSEWFGIYLWCNNLLVSHHRDNQWWKGSYLYISRSRFQIDVVVFMNAFTSRSFLNLRLSLSEIRIRCTCKQINNGTHRIRVRVAQRKNRPVDPWFRHNQMYGGVYSEENALLTEDNWCIYSFFGNNPWLFLCLWSLTFFEMVILHTIFLLLFYVKIVCEITQDNTTRWILQSLPCYVRSWDDMEATRDILILYELITIIRCCIITFSNIVAINRFGSSSWG